MGIWGKEVSRRGVFRNGAKLGLGLAGAALFGRDTSANAPANQAITLLLKDSDSPVFQFTRPIDLKMSVDNLRPTLHINTNLDRIREETVAFVEAPNSHLRFIEERDTRINRRYPAKRIKFADPNFRYTLYFIATGQNVWSVTFQTPESLADRQAPLIERSIQTFRPAPAK